MKDVEKEVEMILEEFQRLRDKMGETPERKSNRNFVGHVFSTVALKFIEGHVPKQYEVVSGPLWIQGLEWIEWDGAIVKRGTEKVLERLYQPEDIIVLFEFKARGMYGGRESARRGIRKIKENFRRAEKKCPNLRNCFYVSLQERTPKQERSIHYYNLVKDGLEPEYTPYTLFHSPLDKGPPYIEYHGEWRRLISAIEKL